MLNDEADGRIKDADAGVDIELEVAEARLDAGALIGGETDVFADGLAGEDDEVESEGDTDEDDGC